MKFWVIIPARYASTRLEGKPLRDIAGKPMIWHVYQNALQSGAERVIIATDDERIYHIAKSFDAEVCMTASTHTSGTERVAEVAQKYHAHADKLIVNLQGDEPLLPPALIHQVADALHNHAYADMATLYEPIEQYDMMFNPHAVKVVTDKQGIALYFSRAPIPWLREEFANKVETLNTTLHARHIGIYAYHAAYLNYCTQLPPCELEKAESLEQLRVLFNGGKIYVTEALTSPGIGVDTEEDLEKVRQLITNNNSDM